MQRILCMHIQIQYYILLYCYNKIDYNYVHIGAKIERSKMIQGYHRVNVFLIYNYKIPSFLSPLQERFNIHSFALPYVTAVLLCMFDTASGDETHCFSLLKEINYCACPPAGRQ